MLEYSELWRGYWTRPPAWTSSTAHSFHWTGGLTSFVLKPGQWELLPSLQTIRRLVSLLVWMGSLHVRPSFGVVGDIGVDLLLSKSCIDQCIRCIFPTKQRVVSIRSHPVAILTYLRMVIALLEDAVRDDAVAYGSTVFHFWYGWFWFDSWVHYCVNS